MYRDNKNIWMSLIVLVTLGVIGLGPIINHVVYCFQSQEYVLLLAGVLVFPVGWFHGLGLWFGFW